MRSDEAFESAAALRQRFLDEGPAIGRNQQVENDVHRRMLGGKLSYSARRRVQAQLQRLERQPPLDRDHDLAVEDEAARGQSAERGDDIGEIAPEILP